MRISLCFATLALAISAVCARADTPADAPDASAEAPDFPVVSGVQLRHSQDDDPQWAKFASGTGTLIFVGAGTLLPLLTDGKDGDQHALRTADSLLVATLITEGLKRATHEKRPNGNDYQSFPSGHATAAFAVAAMQAHYHPRQALLWYAGATAIAASRVELREHYTHDVIAGAAVGYLTARLELKTRRGLIFRPLIRGGARGSGLQVSYARSF